MNKLSELVAKWRKEIKLATDARIKQYGHRNFDISDLAAIDDCADELEAALSAPVEGEAAIVEALARKMYGNDWKHYTQTIHDDLMPLLRDEPPCKCYRNHGWTLCPCACHGRAAQGKEE